MYKSFTSLVNSWVSCSSWCCYWFLNFLFILLIVSVCNCWPLLLLCWIQWLVLTIFLVWNLWGFLHIWSHHLKTEIILILFFWMSFIYFFCLIDLIELKGELRLAVLLSSFAWTILTFSSLSSWGYESPLPLTSTVVLTWNFSFLICALGEIKLATLHKNWRWLSHVNLLEQGLPHAKCSVMSGEKISPLWGNIEGRDS